MPSTRANSKGLTDSVPRTRSKVSQGKQDPLPHRSIIEHFAHSKQGANRVRRDDIDQVGSNKRQKLDLHAPDSTNLGLAGHQDRKLGDMYKFPLGKPNSPPNTIDLTQSPKPHSLSHVSRPARPAVSNGPRKLVVKTLPKRAGIDPEQYYKAVWERLETSVLTILQNGTPSHPKETLYNEVMILCRQNRAAQLLQMLNRLLTSHIQSTVRTYLVASAESQSEQTLAKTVVEAWLAWTAQLEMLRAIFFFLDRSYILRERLPSIMDMGAEKFKQIILEEGSVLTRLLRGICDMIRSDREHEAEATDTEVLQKAIQMFVLLGIYSKHLEPRILAESQHSYWQWGEQTISSTELDSYIDMCDRLFVQEVQRAVAWSLDVATSDQLVIYLEEILIEQRKERITNSHDVGQLLKQDKMPALRKIYALLQRRKLGATLKDAFGDYIIAQGSEIVFDEAREQDMVLRLLDFKTKLDLTWEEAFERNVDLGHTLREAFETFINKSQRSSMTWGTDNPKPGEMIAKYVDQILKSGSKATRVPGASKQDTSSMAGIDPENSGEDEDVEIGRQLDQVLELFRFVHGKAVFEAFYKRDLARRLLLGRSASSDAEKSMLTRLKSECGAGFTHNLEQMFKDIEMAREEITSYKIMLEERQERPPFDLNVNVLSAAAWPSYPDVQVEVPESILKATMDFEQNYKLKHSGRKLEWKHALAHCQLRSSFPRGAKEIVVSSFQAIVLLCFNDTESLSYAEVQTMTRLDDLELKRTLQSLACAKYRVLSKTPKGKEVNTSDNFGVNLSFSHPKYRIKINQIQAKETRQENQQTHERVAADRAFETQAAIVRIMKSRKTITHAELVSEVIRATKSRGPLNPEDIKKNIDKLIEKDYMERDEDAHNTYTYLA